MTQATAAQEATVTTSQTAGTREIKKSERAIRREDEAARYTSARRAIEEEGITVKHFRLHVLTPPAHLHDTPHLVASHTGGITVAYRQLKTDSFIEVATALCSDRDIYDRKIGTTLAVEQFMNLRRIRVPSFGADPAAAIEQLFRGYTTFIDQDD